MFVVQHSTLDTYPTAMTSFSLHVAPPWVQSTCNFGPCFVMHWSHNLVFLCVMETGTVFENCGISIFKEKGKEEWMSIYVCSTVPFHFILFCTGSSPFFI
jgi:hypothetical protein